MFSVHKVVTVWISAMKAWWLLSLIIFHSFPASQARNKMRSTAPRHSPERSKTGKVFVEKPDILDDIIDSLDHQLANGSKYSDARSTSHHSKSSAPNSDHVKLLKEQQMQRTAQTEAIMKQNIQKSLERQNEKQERIFPVLLSNLDKATSFLDSIEKDINLHDETQKNKVRRQFEDWNSTVHGSIQKKIASSINSLNAKALNKKKNEDYEKFLNITNRKPAIFRDIIIESEYDPLEPNKRCIKAKTGYLKDPVKIDAQKAAAEGAMLGPGAEGRSGKPQQLCKETLDVQLWASGQIEATPYGTFSRIMNKNKSKTGGDGAAPLEAAKSATMQSHIVFDHFDYPRTRESIDKEMPRGKRIHPILIYADPKKVFNATVPRAFEEEIAAIRPPENHSHLADRH